MERRDPSRPAPVCTRPIPSLDAATLLSTPESVLYEFVRTTRRANVVKIYRLGLVCRCEWVDDLGYGLRKAGCDADGVPVPGFEPCTHLDKPMLPACVAGVILGRLFKSRYREPPAAEPSSAASKEQRITLMQIRASAGKSIWHPADVLQPDHLGTLARPRPNGEVIEGEVVHLAGLDGDEYVATERASEKPEARIGRVAVEDLLEDDEIFHTDGLGTGD